MRKLLFLGAFLFPLLGLTQIVPPGLGKTPMAGWVAFGVQHKMDTIKNGGWTSSSYVGIGRKSNPDSYNLLEKPSIFILNQEFKHRFYSNWEYILAVSYRTQFNHADVEPFEKLDPAFKQEFRFYGRLYYVFKTDFVNITPTFRPEFRKFFTPNFRNYTENMQIRTRFRIKLDFPLTKDKNHRLILLSEQLLSTSQSNETRKFSKYKYGDSRFSIYYSTSLKNAPFTLNIGYMNNLIGTKNPFPAHHIAFDIVLKI